MHQCIYVEDKVQRPRGHVYVHVVDEQLSDNTYM